MYYKMNILFILLAIINACVTDNHSSYIIPSANICIPDFNDKMAGYFFGPCSGSIECETILLKCRFAKHRDKYCFSRDSHFCAFQLKGNYTNFYQVECG